MTKIRTHYDNLKVARDAPDAVIRAAYKALSQKYHPDKNPGDPRATQVMSVINQSYEVLSDPERRRAHDAWIAREELKFSRQVPPHTPPIPPQWQTPQPEPEPPISSRNLRSRLFSLLLLPFKFALGIFRSVPQLAVIGIIWLVIALIPKSTPLPPAPGPKPYQAEAPEKTIAAPPSVASAALSPITNCRELKSSYPIFSYENGRKRVVRMETSSIFSYTDQNGVRMFSNRKPADCVGLANVSQPLKNQEIEKYIRPTAAPNGTPWPESAGYVHGYPIDNDSGHSKITVDNSQNSSDVFAKLVSLDTATAYPVRQFYIPKRSSFTMNKVAAGKYDLRYRDLETGGLSRSQSFDVDEHRVSDGIEYSEQTITLYKVKDGNFETYGLAEDEF